MNEKELHVIKLLTASAIAYAKGKDVIISKIHGNKDIADLFTEFPTVQGIANDLALARLKDSGIDLNNITCIEDVINAMQLN